MKPITTPRAWRLTTVAVFALVGAIGVLGFGPAARLYEASPVSWPTEKFSAETWRACQRGERYLLLKDLDKQKVLQGKDRAAITGLLGAPDSEAPDGRWLVYLLREWDGQNDLQYAAWLLRIDLDAQGRWSGHEVRREERAPGP